MQTLTTPEKYNIMLPISLGIASLAANHGTKTFLTYLAAMREFEASIRADSTLPVTANGCASIESKDIQPAASTTRQDTHSRDDALLQPPDNDESHGPPQEGKFLFSFKKKIKA